MFDNTEWQMYKLGMFIISSGQMLQMLRSRDYINESQENKTNYLFL